MAIEALFSPNRAFLKTAHNHRLPSSFPHHSHSQTESHFSASGPPLLALPLSASDPLVADVVSHFSVDVKHSSLLLVVLAVVACGHCRLSIVGSCGHHQRSASSSRVLTRVKGISLGKGKNHKKNIKGCWLWLPMPWQRINENRRICGRNPWLLLLLGDLIQICVIGNLMKERMDTFWLLQMVGSINSSWRRLSFSLVEMYANVRTPERHVQTRLYFTSDNPPRSVHEE
ncbi:hypothetical protein PIB30_001657 [Stylosanthes scabra]|uniref:Uncharacterized protein n=1 Tax=Stylosanthes scabra TaxID=79078 RepID=A0ABU6T302_9FABA|nr:hypothetical protein [Stylosanthes scabra]